MIMLIMLRDKICIFKLRPNVYSNYYLSHYTKLWIFIISITFITAQSEILKFSNSNFNPNCNFGQKLQLNLKSGAGITGKIHDYQPNI